MKRKGKMIVLFSVLGVFVLTLLFYYFGAFYPKFNAHAKNKEFNIPGLNETFVPQGMDYYAEDDIFLVSGYMSDGSPSRIYVVDAKTGTAQKYITLKVNDTDYVGHAGGVATDGEKVWVVGDKKLNTFLYADMITAQNNESVSISTEVETGNGCDFVYIYNNQLIVGEFYREGAYDTPASHHIAVSEEEKTHALGYIYDINHTNDSGVNPEIKAVISFPNQAQGMVITKNKEGKEVVVISTSYSIPSSKIMVYDNPLVGETIKKVTLNGKEIPLYELNSNNLIETFKAPSMSEEMAVKDGRVFVLFESACKKYKLVNRTRTKHVYSIEI